MGENGDQFNCSVVEEIIKSCQIIIKKADTRILHRYLGVQL